MDQLPRVEVAPPAAPPREEPPVEEIEEKVLASFHATEAEKPEPSEETAEVPEPEAPESAPLAPEEPTRRINLEELKFGRNYSGGE